jgi:anaerobic C4-dicarboxylate transporter
MADIYSIPLTLFGIIAYGFYCYALSRRIAHLLKKMQELQVGNAHLNESSSEFDKTYRKMAFLTTLSIFTTGFIVLSIVHQILKNDEQIKKYSDEK